MRKILDIKKGNPPTDPLSSLRSEFFDILLRKKQVNNRLISQYRQELLSNNCSNDIEGD